jgi:DNA-binding NarL/FixJ family response regulator
MQTTRIRVMVVDSHPLVRWALGQIAEDQGDIALVGEAASTAEALALAYSSAPSVVTIECSTEASSELDGWALAERLRNSYPQLGIVVLTADHSDAMLFRALNLGVSAFVSKAAPIPDVIAAIRHAAAAPQSFSAAGLAEALRRKRETQERLALSAREQEILLLLHEGLSVPAVAARLFVSLSTAKTYVARLYDKLGARNRAQALMAAVRMGLLDEQLRAVV